MKPLLNRQSKLPEDNWYHLAPKGEHPITIMTNSRPTELIQVIDDAACTAMVNAFRDEGKELLFDYDHFSLDTDKSSEAAGWIQDLANRADGLWARIEWTDTGATAVLNKRYRYPSPTWLPQDCEQLGNNRIRPRKLANAGLTNDPNLKGLKPLANRENLSADPYCSSGALSPENLGSMSRILTNQGDHNMDYKTQIVSLLGIAPDATDQQIVDAIRNASPKLQGFDALKQENETLKNRNQTLEGERKTWLEEQVEKDLDEYKDVIANRENMKALLLANRDDTLKTLKTLSESVKTPEGRKPLHNRKEAGTPDPKAITNDRDKAKASAIANRARQIQKDTPSLTWPQAYNQAKSEYAVKENQ